jgi:hypothetical protein
MITSERTSVAPFPRFFPSSEQVDDGFPCHGSPFSHLRDGDR